ncbi:hypothetical protein GCM10009827_022230 [Dactylosporangium maewongense]|uniref:Uncharacterized protein n=1 Tax=Dactylosporangium maewongense TaxID=634393 RepID=A0ABN1ZYN9_9ACTN
MGRKPHIRALTNVCAPPAGNPGPAAWQTRASRPTHADARKQAHPRRPAQAGPRRRRTHPRRPAEADLTLINRDSFQPNRPKALRDLTSVRGLEPGRSRNAYERKAVHLGIDQRLSVAGR